MLLSQALNTLARNVFIFFLWPCVGSTSHCHPHIHTILFYAYPAATQTNGGILGYLEFNTVFYQRKLLLVYPLTPELDPHFLYSTPERKEESMESVVLVCLHSSSPSFQDIIFKFHVMVDTNYSSR